MNAPLDMTRFIEAKSDQLNADDLLSGPRTIRIRKVAAGEGEQPVDVYYDGDDNKPFRPCKTVRRVMVACWGKDANAYVGRAMTLYRDPEVQFGGMKVGGLRVSHMSHIDGEQVVVVMKTKGKKAPMRIKPLPTQRAPSPAVDTPPSTAADTPSSDAGQSTGAASTEAEYAEAAEAAPAAKPPTVKGWTDGFIASVEVAPDRAFLADLQTNNAESLAKLRDNHAAHYDRVQDAIGARLAALDAADMDEQEVMA